MYRLWQRDGPKGWVLWEPPSHLMKPVTTSREEQHASQIEDRIRNQVSFPADSLHISSIWTSQEPSITEGLDQEADLLSMDIYKEIIDISLGLDN